jgi:hypothetical protein
MTHDDHGGGWVVLAGSTVLLMYIAALVPGLLAVLILAVALALPLLLPAIPLLILGAMYVAVRKLLRAITARQAAHGKLRARGGR